MCEIRDVIVYEIILFRFAEEILALCSLYLSGKLLTRESPHLILKIKINLHQLLFIWL